MFAESVAPLGEPCFAANENTDLFELAFSKIERQQFDTRFLAIGRSANDADKFVEVCKCDQIASESFCALFCLPQFKAGAAQHYFAAMFDVGGVCFLERKQFRPAVIDRQHCDRE